MSTRTILLTACALTAVAHLAAAQPPPAAAPAPGQAPRASTPGPAPAPTPAPNVAVAPAPPPRRVGQPVNIKVDVTISDQASSSAPALKKTVSVVTGDNMNGFIRSSAFYQEVTNPVPLNIDTEPEILADGKIRLRVNLQYDLPGSARSGDVPGAGALRRTELRENLSLILENGKSIVAAQSADPVSDRQVTIEVKATVLK